MKNRQQHTIKRIIKETVKSLFEAQNALVVRGKAVHDAILAADERLDKQRMDGGNFWKNFFKTHTGFEFPDVVDDSTDEDILVQLNKFAVDMKANGYEEFNLPLR